MSGAVKDWFSMFTSLMPSKLAFRRRIDSIRLRGPLSGVNASEHSC